MKIKLSLLKKIIKESVLLEQMTQPNPLLKTYLGTNVVSASTAMKSTDNPDAFQIFPEDRKKLEITLRVPSGSKYYGKPHFIWKESQVGASDKLYQVGSLTNGNGDPFTYEKVAGNKFRVISGPASKAIGKTFTLSPAPEEKVLLPKPETKPDVGETEVARTDSAPVDKSNPEYERRKQKVLVVMDTMLRLTDKTIDKTMIQALKKQLENDNIPLDSILKDLAKPEVVGLTKDQLANYNINISGL